MKINYDKDAKTVRWPALLEQLSKLTRKEKEGLLMAATTYRSGEDSCNSVYMGSMAHAGLMHALGGRYGQPPGYSVLIPPSSSTMLDAGIKSAIHTIEYMIANPRKPCPCCGRIILGEE